MSRFLEVWGLSKYRFLRMICGGKWYLVAHWPHLPMVDPFWAKSPMRSEKVLKMELQA